MKHIKIALLGLSLASALVLPFAFVSAQATGATGTDNPKDQAFQIVPCSGVATAASGSSPATGKDCDFKQLIVMINRIITFLLYLSIPLVLGMIMFTAFKYLTAGGDTIKLESAKKMFVPVAIGLFWILGAYLVVYVLLDNLLADTVGGDSKENVIFLNNATKDGTK